MFNVPHIRLEILGFDLVVIWYDGGYSGPKCRCLIASVILLMMMPLAMLSQADLTKSPIEPLLRHINHALIPANKAAQFLLSCILCMRHVLDLFRPEIHHLPLLFEEHGLPSTRGDSLLLGYCLFCFKILESETLQVFRRRCISLGCRRFLDR